MSTETICILAWSSLTQAQRRALKVIAGARMVRVTGGWRGRGTPLIRLETAQSLIAAGLAWVSTSDGRRQIYPTPAGRKILRMGGFLHV